MKNNINIINNKLFKKQRVLVTVLLALVFVGMSVGYAAYYSELNMASTVGLAAAKKGEIGDLDITKMGTLSDSTEGTIEQTKVKTDNGINFNVKTTASLGFKIWLKYEVTVVNNSNLNYTYMGSDATISFKNYQNEEVPIKYPIITGLIKGDVIGPGETKKMYINFYADDSSYENFGGSYKLSSNIILSFDEGTIKGQRPSFLTALITNETTLNDKKSGEIKFDLTSLYDCSQILSFYVTDSDFELLVSSGETTAPNRIVNKGETGNLIAIVHLKRGVTQKSEYRTKLMGKIMFEGEGKEETFEIGDIVIHNDSSVEEPAEILKNFKVETNFVSNNWPGHATGSIKITNNNNFAITQWVIRLYVNEESKITSIDGSQHKLEVDTEQSRLMIYSDNRYGVNHHEIGAKSSLEVDGITMEISGIKDKPNDWTTVYYDVEVLDVGIDAYYNGAWHYDLVVE